MRLSYDEDFVEEVVRLCAAGRRNGVSGLQIARFNREREKLYHILDPDERNAAFFALHLEWFREWGQEQPLLQILKEFPLLNASLRTLALRKSRARNDEGSELYANEAKERTGVIAMTAERFGREHELRAFLRHELMHIQDMVEPAFGYEPELPLTGRSINQHRLARERYRMLWDVSIDGRITRRGQSTVATREQRAQEFAHVFAAWENTLAREAFESLWNDPSPAHSALVNIVCRSLDQQSRTGPGPGAACPLCGFPTFAWAEYERFEDSVTNAIRSEFPHWEPTQGACARCFAIYRKTLHPKLLVSL